MAASTVPKRNSELLLYYYYIMNPAIYHPYTGYGIMLNW